MIDEVDAVRTLQRVPRWTYTLPLPENLIRTGQNRWDADCGS
jgi:hypothetical protein